MIKTLVKKQLTKEIVATDALIKLIKEKTEKTIKIEKQEGNTIWL